MTWVTSLPAAVFNLLPHLPRNIFPADIWTRYFTLTMALFYSSHDSVTVNEHEQIAGPWNWSRMRPSLHYLFPPVIFRLCQNLFCENRFCSMFVHGHHLESLRAVSKAACCFLHSKFPLWTATDSRNPNWSRDWFDTHPLDTIIVLLWILKLNYSPDKRKWLLSVLHTQYMH